MFFSKSISIPASTTQADPLATVVSLGPGVLRRVWVRWRWGIGNLGGCRISYAEFQYWPLTRGQWYPSTTDPLEFEDSFQLDDALLEVTVEAYNDDDSNAHTLWVGFEVGYEEGVTLTPKQIRSMFLGPGPEEEFVL